MTHSLYLSFVRFKQLYRDFELAGISCLLDRTDLCYALITLGTNSPRLIKPTANTVAIYKGDNGVYKYV